MTSGDDRSGATTTRSSATVYEQALAAVARSVRDELRQSKDRLATPAEQEPLRRRLVALESMRRRL